MTDMTCLPPCLQDSAAGLRSRAVRALGAAVEADPRVLGMVEVQGAVSGNAGGGAVTHPF